jgi:hypothetical protein
MNEGTTLEIPQRIPIEIRMPFQVELMKHMLGDRVSSHEAQDRWGENYGKAVSDIIDHEENQEIRKLIMEGKYADAAPLVVEKLRLIDNTERP